MDGINVKKLSQAAEAGLDKLTKVLKDKDPTKEQFTQARIASSVLATAVRYEATRNARLSMIIRVATSVLEDTDKRREYLAAAEPELKLLK